MDRESSSAGPSPYEIALTGRGAISCWRLGGAEERRGVGILHGLGDHAGRYAELGAALVARGFAVDAIDLPGHGKSYGKRGHVASWLDYRAAVTAWMDRAHAAAPDRTWTLLGQSMGAFVALDWALEHPARVERLVLCAPPFQLGFRPSLLKVKAAQALVRFWPGFSQGNMILPSMLSHDQEVVRAHMEDSLVHYKITARLFLEFQLMRASLMKRVGELKTPTLVIQGGEDHVADPAGSERWVKAAPEGLAELRLYRGLYHEVLAEVGRTEIIASLIDWLETPRAVGSEPGVRASAGAATPPRASRS